MAVVEMSDGVSAFIYHNWLFPENTAKLTIIGSKKMLLYEGKFEKRAVTIYEYAVEEDCGHGDLVEELSDDDSVQDNCRDTRYRA